MNALYPCPDGVTSETLSAWRDGGIGVDEAARLEAHMAGCAACQAREGAFANVGALVSGQRIPRADGVDMAAVRAGRSSHRSRGAPGGPRAPQRLTRAVWGGIGAAVAAALLIAAFTQVFARLNHPTTTVTPRATATATGESLLHWSERAIPPGLTLASGGLNLAFSPASDQDAWLCAQGPSGSFTIWATTDQARTWHIASHLTENVTTQPNFGCQLTPDSLDPRVLALSFAWGCGECGTLTGASYISGDGGATWRLVSANGGVGLLATESLATMGGRTYALSGGSVVVSDDGLATWRAIGPNTPAHTAFFYLWPNPTTGALLVSTGGDQAGVASAWLTTNQGATWTAANLPNGFQINQGEAAWLPASDTWMICGQIPSSIPSSHPIQCTNDLGKTWTARPSLTLTVTCSNCDKHGGPLVTQDGCYPMAMTPDSSMYALCEPAATVTQGQLLPVNLYRLPPGASAWVSLGLASTSVTTPFPTPLPGTPIDNPVQDVGQLLFTGNLSTHGEVVWYSDPLRGILAVAPLPA